VLKQVKILMLCFLCHNIACDESQKNVLWSSSAKPNWKYQCHVLFVPNFACESQPSGRLFALENVFSLGCILSWKCTVVVLESKFWFLCECSRTYIFFIKNDFKYLPIWMCIWMGIIIDHTLIRTLQLIFCFCKRIGACPFYASILFEKNIFIMFWVLTL
jgi:hypothetical protein